MALGDGSIGLRGVERDVARVARVPAVVAATLAPMDAAAASRAVIIVRRARVPADRWEEAPRRAPFPARSNARAKKYLRRAKCERPTRALLSLLSSVPDESVCVSVRSNAREYAVVGRRDPL